MIQELTIKNFQSHENTRIQFHPGVNVIVGSSDNGKSAVIRALRWIAMNKPLGDAFRSYWGGDTEVEVLVDNTLVIRHKGKKSYYKIGNTELGALGSSVPEEVSKLLNIEETNIQYQMDAPFLISQSPGDVAKYFNKMANLEEIDLATKSANQLISSFNSEVKRCQLNIQDTETKLTEFSNVEQMEEDVEAIELLEQDIKSREKHKEALDSKILSINYCSSQLATFEALDDAEKSISEALTLLTTIKQKKARAKQLEDLLEEIEDVEEKVESFPQYPKTTKLLDKALKQKEEIKQGKTQISNLSDFIEEIQNNSEKLYIITKDLKKDEKQLADNMPEVCPLCNSKLKR